MNSYKLKITLIDSDPAITRTVSVPKDITFRDLHDILQAAMGWYDEHGYEFEIKPDGVFIGPVAMETQFLKKEDDTTTYLSEYEYKKIRYVYDFGDYWEHDIRFLKDTDMEHPKVLKYSGNCPPENCGGIQSFQQKKEILLDPSHKEYRNIKRMFDEDYYEYDLDGINDYLQNGWSRFDPQTAFSVYEFDMICDAFCSMDHGDTYYDANTSSIVDLKPGSEPKDGLLPILGHDEFPVFGMMEEFLSLKDNAGLKKRVGSVRNPKMKYKKFISLLLRDKKSLDKWDPYLESRLIGLATEWAIDNGFDIPTPPMDIEDIDSLMKMLNNGATIIENESELLKESFICPECGRSSTAKVDPDGGTTQLNGMEQRSAILSCEGCGTETALRKLNDGYYIGYHYDGMHHPCHMVEDAITEFIGLAGITDPSERFLAVTRLIIPLLSLEMTRYVDGCMDMMRSAMSPENPVQRSIIQVIESILEWQELPEEARSYLREMPANIAVLAIIAIMSHSVKFSEIAELHELANSLFETWSERGLDYFIVRRMELLTYTDDERFVDASREMISLLDEAIGFVQSKPRDFNPMFAELAKMYELFSIRLWELGFNGEVAELSSRMGSYLDSCDEGVPISLRSIYGFRKGLVELTLGGGMDVAEQYFRIPINIHSGSQDSGPMTVTRSLPSALILYRFGLLEENRLKPMMVIFIHLLLSGICKEYDVIQCCSYCLYALMRDRNYEEALEFSKMMLIKTEHTEEEIVSEWENPMSLWDLHLSRLV